MTSQTKITLVDMTSRKKEAWQYASSRDYDYFSAADDVIFSFSLVTSFLSLVMLGLRFNERSTGKVTKYVVALPMFAAFAAARAFTLAVFLKETLHHWGEWLGGLGVLLLFCGLNVWNF